MTTDIGSLRRWTFLPATVLAGLALAPTASAVPDPVPGSAYVRVNQVGYPATATKTALLMASEPETGATFAVRDASGSVVYRASIGARQPRWSTRYPHVYALDLSPVSAAGEYSISVDGPIDAASPTFRIDTGAAIYAGPLANALFFYQVERDGPDFIPSALRSAPGHLNDAHAMTYATPPVVDDSIVGDLSPLGTRIDASGGWWDAGDYPKFLQTTNYTVAVMLVGVRDFPGQMGAASPSSDFTAEARFGVDFLQRLWNDRTSTLYYQVGVGDGNDSFAADHDIWRLPQADDTYAGTDPRYRYIRNRPVFRAGPAGSAISPNLAGRDAAALALCYQVFRRSDPAYAHRCLRAAEHQFDHADTSPSGDLTTVIPFDFYPETEWRDDLELGAAELALALQAGPAPQGLPHTDASYYLARAAHWARAYIDGPGDAADTLNLYDVSGLAHAELARALDNAGNPAGLELSRGDLVDDIGLALERAVAQSSGDAFGFGFPWNVWDTTSHGAGLSVQASLYDRLSGTDRYAAWSTRWLGNVLGANAWGLSFIVGDGSLFPHCLQHQVANIVGSLDGSGPVLAGAAVEGPNGYAAHGTVAGMRACPADGVNPYAVFNGRAIFRDDMETYDNTEPAIDLTATSPLAFALQSLGAGEARRQP